MQERKSQRHKSIRPAKQSGKHAIHPQLLTTIKEEENLDVEKLSKSEETGSSAASALEESINQNRKWGVGQILKKRTTGYRHASRVKSRTNSKEDRVLVQKTGVIQRSYLPVVFHKIIRLYSSSAFRYAMFRSNRRYKPGD